MISRTTHLHQPARHGLSDLLAHAFTAHHQPLDVLDVLLPAAQQAPARDGGRPGGLAREV